MTPQQLAELRNTLPPFGEAAAPSPLLLSFLQFYGLDYAQQQPALDYRAGTVPSGNYQLVVHRWSQRNAGSNLLIVHGLFDHTGLFGRLIEYGLARHCNVLVFDLPGHGLSSGEPAAINDFGEYSQAISDVLAAVAMPDLPLWVMAQSTGCAALIDLAGKQPWPFAATVLLAPLVRPAGWLKVRLAHMLVRHFADSVTRKFTDNSADRAFLDFVRRDPLQGQRIPVSWVGALRRWLAQLSPVDLGVGPALVVQGDADKTVAWRYNVKVIRKLFPGSRLISVAGAGHQLANESGNFRERYLAEVDRYLDDQIGPDWRGERARPASSEDED